MTMSETEIAEWLERDGPLTGAELVARTEQEALPLWRACRTSDKIGYELVGRRYLRFDRTLDSWARLSPSIGREFLTYTVFGGSGQEVALRKRADKLARDSERISRVKSYLARETMASVLAETEPGAALAGKVTFIIAGDVTYRMAHAVPRQEPSTGLMVRGSDLDVIVVASDDMPEHALRELDSAIYRRKHYLLVNPAHREEIDYVVKRVAKVREQLRLDTFEHCVASKILHEGEMLCGSREVFDLVKTLVWESGVAGWIAELTRQAASERATAEQYLISDGGDAPADRYVNLFYTREEHAEIY